MGMSISHDDDTNGALLELDAMRIVAQALQSIEPASRERVLRWAMDRFAAAPALPSTPMTASEARRSTTLTPVTSDLSTHQSEALAELYAACDPRTDADKTLIVSYWLQEVQGAQGIDAQSVNSELKQLGHGVGNITRAFDRLKETRPQLMIQTKKSGTTRQARKTYRVTVEGRRCVQAMMNRGGTD